VSFDRIAESGVSGDARVASAEKGEWILSRCASAPADIILRDPWAK
jgi:creatinine amidohydrolase